ncbi:ACP S-malonyltransferase [Jatrophihabitans lederbergiae]|uniref:ACP S-malonyltransferase n=1 Tax=Jatrophihabitans lederbergiae TaxID=3075547 RepID=UPI0037BEB544
MIAIFAPGQGAQKPGMLLPWLDVPGIADEFARLCEVSGMDLVGLGTTASAEQIKDTAVAQPLIVALGVTVAAHLGLIGAAAHVVTGHSVGELTAAAVAGVLTPDAAVELAAHRGAAMAAACARTPTGMAAVVGGSIDDALACLATAGLTAANYNGAGQIVAAGSSADLKTLAAAPPRGLRIVPLGVAGAFHTEHMAPAEWQLRSYAHELTPSAPKSTLLSNADGTAVPTGAEVVQRIVRQVTSPVRWDLCLDTCRDLGVRVAIELAPGGILTGIARRALPGVDLLAIKSPDDLPAARELLASVR